MFAGGWRSQNPTLGNLNQVRDIYVNEFVRRQNNARLPGDTDRYPVVIYDQLGYRQRYLPSLPDMTTNLIVGAQ